MSEEKKNVIRISNAKTHNLKGVSLEIPHHQFIVITGVSGSGKSSLAFDIIAKEGQRRYFETLPSFARQFMGKISPVNADRIEGLAPVITVSQKTTGMNSRSTVGTLSDLYSWLRLLYARTGVSNSTIPLSRSLFSFNANQGKCQRCNGIGKEEEIDLKKLIAFPEKTIREGALAPTLPTGYIMYSQVTIDVLNKVCAAEGFNVNIPWKDLSEQEQQVVLYGSEKIKVPFGKHSIESRLKWTGIKAKPREEGYYKGMIPIMSDILRRDRNANILRYVSAITCKDCKGKRLNKTALSVHVHGRTIADLLEMSLDDLSVWLSSKKWDQKSIPIIEKIRRQIQLISTVGLNYLTLNQSAKELSGSEIQRIRLVNQIGTDLSNVLYVFDEPSIGLHASENQTIIQLLRNLVAKGNTVIVVEHDLETIKSADWIVDIGPKAGKMGGQLLFNGPLKTFLNEKKLGLISPTFKALTDTKAIHKTREKRPVFDKKIGLIGCQEGNLHGANFEFNLGQLNIVTGRSGGGKTHLVKKTLMPLILSQLKGEENKVVIQSYSGLDSIDRLVFADQSPIGRTPRSNPATYIGISDHIRDAFSKLPLSKEKGFTKSRFSFNTKGGRCETCHGAGKTQIGMHFLGKIDLICSTCNGKRFNSETLSITYEGKSIAEIYELTVDEALLFFSAEKKLQNGLHTLQKIGLGYLTLGQSSTTLSGGEAQRIKLANELQKKAAGNTLYILDEPSIGLHTSDLKNLLHLFDELLIGGNTIVCIEQDETILSHADVVIELGASRASAPTAQQKKDASKASAPGEFIQLKGVATHLLKNINVTFPKRQLSVVTGLSGSGKSSLVYDSLYAEANNRFSESLSTFNRSLIQSENRAILNHASGLTPTIAIQRKKGNNSSRSTVGTLTGIHDHFRLLFSRLAQLNGQDFTAQHFSFNHKLGACPQCKGYGFEKKCDPEIIIADPDLSLLEGALNSNKTAAYFTNPQGQFIAILKEIGRTKKWDLTVPWKRLSAKIQDIILFGTGDQEWETHWEFKTKTRTGSQQLNAKWSGFCHYINDEYERRRDNKNIQPLLDLLHDVPCSVCKGNRLKKELLTVQFHSKNSAEAARLSVRECHEFIQLTTNNATVKAILSLVGPPIIRQLETLIDLGLGYLTLDRLTGSLSGGELQRVRLAGQLSAQLFGVTYILDEPTIGLDTVQVKGLIKLLRQLLEKGNTVIVIEHDKDFISAADYLVEMGPFSGIQGGEIIFQGKAEEIKNHPETVTHSLLYDTVSIDKIKPKNPSHEFGIQNAKKNNLKGIDVTFKSNRITALTGISGSGKSTLIKEILSQSILKKRAVGCDAIFGFEHFDAVLLIDQDPIGMNALSCPAVYTGILEKLQVLFAKTPEAKKLQLKKGHFSYLTKDGKCLDCNGYGEIKTSMDFMSDLWVKCETCNGKRYHTKVNAFKIPLAKSETGSIGELLDHSATQLLGLFDDAKLNDSLQTLIDIGIGHLQLGQAGNTLSGGEAQRLKLAKALLSKKGTNLYLFDEPSSGLHQQDLLKLIAVFRRLIEQGHSIIFIEHNSTLINIAHDLVKLGPGSGAAGGTLI